jgi:tyrosine aminotransferase
MQADAFGGDDETFTDVEFAKRLLAEESVLVLPGTCFHAPGYLRIVITVPEDELEEAWNRLEVFCERHSRERKLTDSPKELHVLNGKVKAALKIVDSDTKLFAE